MSHRQNKLRVFALLLPALWSGSALAADVVLDKIVAVVNEGVVLSSELTAEATFLKQQAISNQQALPSDDILRERVLERLIDQEIRRQHAGKLGIAVDASSVNRAVEQVAKSNNMDTLQFRQTLQSQGFDYRRFRANIEQELLLTRLIQRDVESRIKVSKQEIDDFVQAANNSGERNRYRIGHILIALSPSAPPAEETKAKARAAAVLARLQSGTPFAQVAASDSDGARALEGGDLGWRQLQEVPDFLANAIKEMQVGDISQPLRSPNGLHIVELTDKDNGQQKPQNETLVRHIFITSADENPQQKLAQIRQQIVAGKTFATAALEFSEDPNSASEGGELPWFAAGQMPSEIQETADALQPGIVSEPFSTQYGWHILEVLDRRTRNTNQETQRQQAELALRQRKIEQETERWIRTLRNESFIEIRG